MWTKVVEREPSKWGEAADSASVFVAAGSLSEPVTPLSEPRGSASLVCDRVGRLLPLEDFEQFAAAQESERSAAAFAAIYTAGYAATRRLTADYEQATDAARADSIAAACYELMRLDRRVADTLATVWGRVFDTKTFCYNYIFDRLNRFDLIEKFQTALQETMRMNMEDTGRYASDALARYRNEKALLLGYELVVARLLRLQTAEDSLAAVAREFSGRELKFAKVELRERSFIEYADVKIEARQRYGQRNPIPSVKIYRRGTVYRILLGAFAKPPSPATFKGAYPLALVRGAATEYYVGGLATLQQAEEAVATLRKAGFIDPQIVVWTDGAKMNLTKENAAGIAAHRRYRVEIAGADSLGEEVRAVIGRLAGDRDVVRTAAPGGGAMFIVGSLDSLLQAARLAEAVRLKQGDLRATVIEAK